MRIAIILAVLAVGACANEPPTEPPPATPPTLRTTAVPEGWFGGTSSPTSYVFGLDRLNQRSGAAAAFLASRHSNPTQFVSLGQNVRADQYRGRRVRWSGWVRPTGVTGSGAGLWMRVDGPGETQAFDNMANRRILDTSDWTRYSVVLDVPANAIGLAFGVLLGGPGDVVIDDLQFEVVGAEVPTTNMQTEPSPSSWDSAAAADYYERIRSLPVNLDFEGVRGFQPETFAWLTQAVVPLATVDPGADLADLAPLATMIGAARVVALGEGTHGTREFFLMKHRVFEYLVRYMGFRHFAIEATWAESNDLNRWVQGGDGDPAVLLSRLYFWTWNTQEVLDFVRWMREWNTGRPAADRVQFVGFDMQFPGAPMDTVAAFVSRVDSAARPFVDQRYTCLVPFRDVAGRFSRPASQYAALPSPDRAACRMGLQEVFDTITARRGAYEPASDAATYAAALHSARIVQQWEVMTAATGTSEGPLSRDRFMAENVLWLLEQAGPGARMMLWAHNGHVTRAGGVMGAHLATLGSDYVNLGFLFGHGAFNAVAVGGGQQAFIADYVPSNSLEAAFSSTLQPRLLFDARRIPQGGQAAAPLAGPIPMRVIGAVYNPVLAASYYSPAVLPHDFDLLIYLETTTASTLLPFVSASAAPPDRPVRP